MPNFMACLPHGASHPCDLPLGSVVKCIPIRAKRQTVLQCLRDYRIPWDVLQSYNWCACMSALGTSAAHRKCLASLARGNALFLHALWWKALDTDFRRAVLGGPTY